MSAAAGAVPRMARPEVHDAAPALGWYTDHVLYHEVWNRPELSKRDRSLVTIAALVTGGKMAQLKGHLGRGLDNGLAPAEIVEIITQLAFFGGWPNVMSAVPVMTGVFEDRGVDRAGFPASVSVPIGESPVRSSPPGRFAATLRDCTSRPVVDELWTRPELAARDRSLLTFAAVLALGEYADLIDHARRALADGVEEVELCETVAHLAFYIGWPRAAAAADLLDQRLATNWVK